MKNALFLIVIINFAYAFEMNSGKDKVHVVELYTSESCSSCPPAEEFISRFKKSDALFKKIIPMAFHVAYWNHLNWKDKYSKKEFSQRQRVGSQKINSNVYTPQLLLNGVDVANSSILSLLKKKQDVGNLNVKVSKGLTSAKIKFTATSVLNLGSYFCHSAVLINESSVDVTSGENSGKTLKEDFIVVNEFKKRASKIKNLLTCDLDISIKKSKDQSIVFWIVESRTNKIVQAVGQNLTF